MHCHKRYLTDDIHFDSQRLPQVSTMVKLHGVNWVKKQKYWHCDILEWNLDLTNPLYNEVLGVTNDIARPSYSKIYAGKEPRYNKTSLQRKYFVSPFAFRFIEVPL